MKKLFCLSLMTMFSVIAFAQNFSEETLGKANTWHFNARTGPAIYKSEKSGDLTSGHNHKSSVGFEAEAGVNYYIINGLFASIGVGYYETSSSTTFSTIGSTQHSEVKSRNIYSPVEIGYRIPIVGKFAFILETGVSFLYSLGGYCKLGDEKITFSEFEDKYNESIDRFGCFYRASGGFELSDLKIMGYYAIPLTTKGILSNKNFWGITVGIEI